jgi:hypothetical protein
MHVFIDYFASSFTGSSALEDFLKFSSIMRSPNAGTIPAPKIARYRFAYQCAQSGLRWYHNPISASGEVDRQGIHVVISGQPLNDDGRASRRRLYLALAQSAAGNVSRIDIARDTPRHSVDEMLSIYIDNIRQGKTKERKLNEIWNDRILRSFYVGSRRSDTMLRIYDKAYELKLGEGEILTRLEFELKRKAARAFAASCGTPAQDADARVTHVTRAASKLHSSLSLSLLGTSIFDESDDFADIDLIRPDYSREPGDNDAWIASVVIPALRRRIRTAPEPQEFLDHFMSRLLAGLD